MKNNNNKKLIVQLIAIVCTIIVVSPVCYAGTKNYFPFLTYTVVNIL